MGHEDAFPRPRLSARCRFSEGTFVGPRGNGRDAPIPDLPTLASEQRDSTQRGHPPVLLDDLVGAVEDREGDGQSDRLGRVQVDHKLEPCRLLDRRIGRVLARENTADIGAYSADHVSLARSIAAEGYTNVSSATGEREKERPG